MSTLIILEGALGKKFGREWDIEATSIAEGLRIIDANKPGLFNWIKSSLPEYPRYQVICQYDDERTEELDDDTFWAERKPKSVHIVPIIEGASAGARFVIGATLAIIGFGTSWFSGPVGTAIGMAGVSMMVGSVIEMLTPKPSLNNDAATRKDQTSYYFDGPVNTSMQGIPVPLIYGRILTGSHAITAAVTVDQLM